LPGAPGRWIWAFTCPEPECPCRTAVVLARSGDRGTLLELGRPVADAWLEAGSHAQVAQSLENVTAFAIDLDSREIFPPIAEAPLNLDEHPELKAVVDHLDDDVLDAIARIWCQGKGMELPPQPAESGAKIEVEGWRPGVRVVWDDAYGMLRADTYAFGVQVFEAFELYCVMPGCSCSKVVVDFGAILPRGAPYPGRVEFDGSAGVLCPTHPRHRPRLTELWTAYCRRHPDHRERFARRGAAMHALAGRIVAASPLPGVSRNAPCPCGSGKKYKRCCAAG
jgi:hypothetical protein